MINVEVTRHGNENVAGLMRRFSRKVQSSGIIRRMRGLRYHSRKPSSARMKNDALTKLGRIEKYTELYKLGREPVAKKKGR